MISLEKSIYKMDCISADYIFGGPTRTLIMAAGSDYRACEMLRKLEKAGMAPEELIVFIFRERGEDLQLGDHYFDFRSFSCGRVHEIPCSIMDPKESLVSLFAVAERFTEGNMSIDISCFTKPFFFYLLKLFKERFSLSSIDIYYTEPMSYLFRQGLYSAFSGTAGPLQILEIPGFSGAERSGESRVLVVLLGFDGDLSREITEDVSPSFTVVVNGFPGYAPKYKDISLIANEKLVSSEQVELKYGRANNPFEVFNVLESVRQQNSGRFISVAPLGTKPMALGACLFALNYPETRIVYPFPASYQRITTDKCWQTWHYNTPLVLN